MVHNSLLTRGIRDLSPTMKRVLLFLSALLLVPMNLLAWTNGELLIWMDSDRGKALAPIAKKFENNLGHDRYTSKYYH
jgi:hypothetical protein